MKTLQEAIDRINNKGGAASSLRKHLNAVGIHEWDDLTRSALYDFHDHLTETLAPASAKTISGQLRAMLVRYEEELNLPSGWRKILLTKSSKPMKIYLSEEDLARLAPYLSFD